LTIHLSSEKRTK